MAIRNLLSWTDDFAHEHAHLGILLTRVRRALGDESGEARDASLGTLLVQLTLEVREHMEFEEQDGYLAPVRQQLPRMHEAIERMRGEHDVLQSQLARILTDATVGSGVYAFGENVSPRLQTWLDSMRDHERRENQLVQEAFNTDVSAGD